jgi:hypothetical protein
LHANPTHGRHSKWQPNYYLQNKTLQLGNGCHSRWQPKVYLTQFCSRWSGFKICSCNNKETNEHEQKSRYAFYTCGLASTDELSVNPTLQKIEQSQDNSYAAK